MIINLEQIKDVKNIAYGAYAPLKGFLREHEFKSVVSEMKLDGKVWPIPIVLDTDDKSLKGDLVLLDANEKPIAKLKNAETYSYDKEFMAKNVFNTLDRNHPGVDNIFKMKNYLIGGEIELLDISKDYFPEFNFTPEQTKQEFKKRGWNTIVAFQTRNVPHRGHEFLQKEALKEADGLFVQPVIGEKKIGDFKDEYILISYEVLINKHYPKDKVFLGILPLKMRYAGPREAVFHALIRKNFGCTHFIVGRDHAGVGDYYPPFAAQEIFNGLDLGIKILKYPEVVYCDKRNKHFFINEAPDGLSFSGTKLREAIKNKETPEEYIIRPAVFSFLANSENALVDEMYNKKNEQKGFVLWFTGFSQSGKTTTADRVRNILKDKGLRIERLDGDIVRQSISSDLGFSKEDRDENIRRIGFVSGLLSKNGLGVISSFISPYIKERDEARKRAVNFIEVFCKCPLDICESRDTKGLYAKARAGEIKNFTGISDPYEEPENPEIVLDTGKDSIDECVNKVINYMQLNGYI